MGSSLFGVERGTILFLALIDIVDDNIFSSVQEPESRFNWMFKKIKKYDFLVGRRLVDIYLIQW